MDMGFWHTRDDASTPDSGGELFVCFLEVRRLILM
jgi:hypothetical protein